MDDIYRIKPFAKLGNYGHPEAILLSTAKRGWIQNRRDLEANPALLREYDRELKKKYPGITTRSLTATYNCFGMVFACRRAFVFPESIDMILSEDGYNNIDRSSVFRGDLIVYRSGPKQTVNHIGVVYEVRPLLEGSLQNKASTGLTILSKWGQNGEYLHLEKHVPPDFGPHIEYYSDRRLG